MAKLETCGKLRNWSPEPSKTIGKHNENEGWLARETNKVRKMKKNKKMCEKEQKLWKRAKYENVRKVQKERKCAKSSKMRICEKG